MGRQSKVLIPYAGLLLVLLILCVYSLWFLSRRASRPQSYLILIMVGSLIIPLLALDLLKGSSQALVTRYMFPSWVALQVAVAYLLAAKTDCVNPAPDAPRVAGGARDRSWRWVFCPAPRWCGPVSGGTKIRIMI